MEECVLQASITCPATRRDLHACRLACCASEESTSLHSALTPDAASQGEAQAHKVPTSVVGAQGQEDQPRRRGVWRPWGRQAAVLKLTTWALLCGHHNLKRACAKCSFLHAVISSMARPFLLTKALDRTDASCASCFSTHFQTPASFPVPPFPPLSETPQELDALARAFEPCFLTWPREAMLVAL